MKIFLIVGARPNFVKLAPLYKTFKKEKSFIIKIVHTGQHYDYELDRVFFEDFEIPQPDYYLNVGSDSHARQTAKIMIKLDELFDEDKPDWIFVFGDVNSTVSASLTAIKRNIKIAHVEAGLRSFDMSMPEEINRILTDRISHLHFVSEPSGVQNLIREGVNLKSIHLVGNIMIESLIEGLKKIENRFDKLSNEFSISEKSFALLTLHRPSNVDNIEKLRKILDIVSEIAKSIKIIFPAHPRTLNNLKELNFKSFKNFIITKPLRYLDFITLMKFSAFVMTDSGGIQEETTYLKIPCLTLRENTERPITIEKGTNVLVGDSREKILKFFNEIMEGKFKKGEDIPLWDDKVSQRILSIFLTQLL
ncbi:MAG: UDP-N-acetylglucosamine 2-epimerase (non-hydrolyzing) [candidate division WOR-3 bacterium]